MLEKKEKEMTREEKIKLDLVRMLWIWEGYNIRDAGQNYDLTNGSKKMRLIDFISQKFDLSSLKYRDEKDAKNLLPERLSCCPGDADFNSTMQEILIARSNSKEQSDMLFTGKVLFAQKMNDKDSADFLVANKNKADKKKKDDTTAADVLEANDIEDATMPEGSPETSSAPAATPSDDFGDLNVDETELDAAAKAEEEAVQEKTESEAKNSAPKKKKTSGKKKTKSKEETEDEKILEDLKKEKKGK
jgi:hypothetical protein